MTGHFEAKKHAYRQTQDGIVVSFVIHPNDLDAAFAVAPLGTRYMIGFAEIGDDGKPDSAPELRTEAEKAPEDGPPSSSGAPKERRPFASLPLSQQAAIRCQDNDFKLFLGASNAEDAVHKVREFCGVESRSKIIDGERSGALWHDMEQQYQSWLLDQRYAGVRR